MNNHSRTFRISLPLKVLIEISCEFDGPVQRVTGLKRLSDPNLLCVFVLLGEDNASDRFFIFPWKVIQKLCKERYGSGYRRPRNPRSTHFAVRRPRNPKSTHFAVRPQDLQDYDGDWERVVKATA